MRENEVKLKDATDFWDNPCLYIMLGPACNMICRHCSQMPYKKFHQFDDEVSEDVKDLIGNYIQYYQKYYQKKRNQMSKAAMISFWGGEALLHWKVMKSIIEEFTIKYDMKNNPAVIFCIASNGLGITDEMVEFINKYNVQFNFSFDAPYPYAARGFVPETTIDRLLKIKKVCVLGSFNALNCDLYAALNCMRAKFEGKAYRFFMNFQLLYTSELPDDLLDFNFDKIRDGIKMCRIAIQLGDKYFGEAIYPLVKPIKFPEERKLMLESGMRHCVPGKRYLTVDLKGNVVRCHNDGSTKIGTVYDSLEEIHRRGYDICSKLEGKKQIEKCFSCEHRDVCPGGCFMGLKTADGYFRSCEMYTKPMYSIVKEELSYLSQPLSEEDRKWFYERKPAYDKLAEEYANGIYYNNMSIAGKENIKK